MPSRWVTGDTVYGGDRRLREWLEEHAIRHVMAVKCIEPVWTLTDRGTGRSAAVVMMMLGHIVGGLALFGGCVLAAAMAVALAGMSGMRHMRKLVSGRSFHVVQRDAGSYTSAEAGDSDDATVVKPDRSEYTEVR